MKQSFGIAGGVVFSMAALMGASAPASAAILQADFTGVITVSRDDRGLGETVGRLFGEEFYLTATPGTGQVGETITGTIYIDDSIYSDSAYQSNIGVYGGTANAFRTVFTIAGKTFDTNAFHDVIGGPYSSEQAALYDPTGVQDYFVFYDNEAYKPYYNSGAFGFISFGLSLLSNQYVQNFLNGTELNQVIALGAAELGNLQTRVGSYEISLYCGWTGSLGITASGNCPTANAPFGVLTDQFGRNIGPASGSLSAQMLYASGEFTLTSMTLQPVVSAVPVPAAAWLFGTGLLGLVTVARRRSV